MQPFLRDRLFAEVSESLPRLLEEPTGARLVRETAEWGAPHFERLEFALSVHGIAGSIDRALPPGADGLPPPAARLRSILAERGELVRRRADRMAREFTNVSALFRAAGVGALPLKGARLLCEPGLDLSHRVSADLDFLVTADGRRRAESVLAADGWEVSLRVGRQHEWRRLGDRVVDPTRGEHPGNPLKVELHEGALPATILGRRIDPAARLTAGAMNDPGTGGLLPSPADTFAHFLVHHTGDLFSQGLKLSQALDLPILWKWLADTERRRAVGVAVEFMGPLAGLFPRVAADILPAVVPESLFTLLPEPPPALLAWFRARPLLRFTRQFDLESLAWISFAEGWGARGRILARVAFPSASEIRRQVPGVPLPLAWVVGQTRRASRLARFLLAAASRERGR